MTTTVDSPFKFPLVQLTSSQPWEIVNSWLAYIVGFMMFALHTHDPA